MSEGIIVALIGLGGSAAGSLIGVLASNRLTQYRLAQLEQKVDKHNNVIERMFDLEERASVMEERQRVANHRIDNLERGKGVKL